jgi:hypothetical protein
MRLTRSLEATVDDVGDFLSTVLPLMRDEVVSLHDGKPARASRCGPTPSP